MAFPGQLGRGRRGQAEAHHSGRRVTPEQAKPGGGPLRKADWLPQALSVDAAAPGLLEASPGCI